MIEEFHIASNLLNVALERYLAACSAIANCYDPSNGLEGISRAISELIPSALQSAPFYETKLKRAIAILNQTRNVVPTITPIGTLPPDMLTYIFQLVLDAQPSYSKQKHNSEPFPLKYPDTLSHVCSRWRQIAISSRMLWSRVDIPFQTSISSTALLARAELFAARADPSPLDLYIGGRADNKSPDFETRLHAFCASVASRVKSLNLSADCLPKLHFPLLQSIFTNCTPGTLDELIINEGNSCRYLIKSSDTSGERLNFSIAMPHQELEERLAPISVLRLTGVYFDWTSKAYEGLVELYFNFRHLRPEIPLIWLLLILYNSPGLRVLHMDLDIVDIELFDGVASRVSLNDLRVVNLRRMKYDQCGAVLWYLHPGTKSLRLSLQYIFRSGYPSLFDDGLTKFFARSNVTELYIECGGEPERYGCLDLLELLNSLHVPHLRVLSLARFILQPNMPSRRRLQNNELNAGTPHDGHEPGSLPAFSQLDSLHLTKCDIILGDLQTLVQTLRIQTLRLAGCSVCYEESGRLVGERQLARVAPTVRLRPAPKFLSQWDPWG